MNDIGTDVSSASPHAAADTRSDNAPAAKTPHWLLWSTGITAAVLSAVAFVLWGTNGASTLFDMIVALCT